MNKSLLAMCADEIAERDKKIEDLKEALKLACEELIEGQKFESKEDRHYTLQAQIEYFKAMAEKKTRKRGRK